MVFKFIRHTNKVFFAQYHFKNTLKTSTILTIRKFGSHSKNLTMEKVIAVGQMRSTNDKAANRQQVQQIVESAVKQNARFVFLPECCDYVGNNRQETLNLAEDLSGETVKFYQQLAKDKNVWLSLGGIHELNYNNNKQASERLNNSHIVINSEGDLVAVYRKLHLFDVETPEFRFQESTVMNGGNHLVSPLVDTPLQGGLGLLICYDLRFPEVSTILRKNGATYLTYPSAFAYSTGLAHWESLLRARAIENQCYVIAPAQVGYHNEKRRSYGHAMVIDPWGKVLVECDKDDKSVPQCQTTTISLESLMNIRSRLPCFEHRRNDVYTLAPIQMVTADESVNKSNLNLNSNFTPIPVEEETTPYFLFEKYPVPKSSTFLETPLSIAFTNIRCVVPGHILVATRRCVERLRDLTPEEIVDFFMTVCKTQRLLEQYYKTTSSTVTVQDGQFAGQTVRHVHCHIMPRKEGDFEHNDQIYIELNRHDDPKECESRKYRTLEERAHEANAYREFSSKFPNF